MARLRARHAARILPARCYERESVPFKALDGVVDAVAELVQFVVLADAAHARVAPCGDLPEVLLEAVDRSGDAVGHEDAHGDRQRDQHPQGQEQVLRQDARRLR